MSLPRISVVIPSFNHARFLRQTLESVLCQKYPALEVIVMDGGSTDGTVKILEQYAPKLTYWVSQKDGGQTDALVKGFERATGDVLCWLNSDDLFEPWTLLEVGRFFESHPKPVAVYGDATWIDEAGGVLREQREIPFNRFIWTYTYNYVPGMSMFWRKSAYEQVGGLDRKFNLAMDADLWSRLSEIGRIAHVRRFWSRQRFYASQKNQRLRRDSDREDQAIRERMWNGATPSLLKTRRIFARAMRVAWRAAILAYSPRDVQPLDRLLAQKAPR